MQTENSARTNWHRRCQKGWIGHKIGLVMALKNPRSTSGIDKSGCEKHPHIPTIPYKTSMSYKCKADDNKNMTSSFNFYVIP